MKTTLLALSFLLSPFTDATPIDAVVETTQVSSRLQESLD
jgi:hypothetical protein